MRAHLSLKSFTIGVNGRTCLLRVGRQVSTTERSTVWASSSPSSSFEAKCSQDPSNKRNKPHFPDACGSCYYFQPFLEDFNKVNSGASAASKREEHTSSMSSSIPKPTLPQNITKRYHHGYIKLKDRQSHSDNIKWIKGALKNFAIDTSVPPISQEELIHWRLDRSLHFINIFTKTTASVEPNFLLPPDAMVTSLGPKMDQIDCLYRKRGWYTPSEVAEALIGLTPTFFVEPRHVFNLFPPNLIMRIESKYPRREWISKIFSRYPMLFKLSKPSYQKSVVKLNTDMWFVRAHPDFKKGNRLHYKNNAEYRAGAGGVMSRNVPTGEDMPESGAANTRATEDFAKSSEAPSTGKEGASTAGKGKPVELRIFEILVSHLPRVPTPKTDPSQASMLSAVGNLESDLEAVRRTRYAAMPLVEWVNGFSQAELDFLNTVSQEYVLRILQDYPLVFQLMNPKGDSLFLYADREVVLRSFQDTLITPLRGSLTENASGPAGNGTRENGSKSDEEVEEEDAETREGCFEGTKMEMDNAVCDTEAAPSYTAEEVQARERQFHQAIRDDLIGVEDLAQGIGDDFSENGDIEDLEGGLLSDDDDLSSSDSMEEGFHDKDTFLSEKIRHTKLFDDEAEMDKTNGDLHHPQGPSDIPVASLNLDVLYLRRLPPAIAPRSLSNFNHEITPMPELVEFVASFLAPPPSLREVPENFFLRCQRKFRCGSVPTGGEGNPKGGLPAQDNPRPLPWRWVRVQKIYLALSPEQRQGIRKVYKGLVNFLRLHGELFEVSEDMMHVIAHDPKGVLAPIVPTQKAFRFQQRVVLPKDFDDNTHATAALIGEEARRKYKAILGDSQIPSTRNQLILLDPLNPLLDREVWYDEVAQLLPYDRAVRMSTMMQRLPPIIKAAIGRGTRAHLASRSNEYFTVFEEDGVVMMQNKKLGAPVKPQHSPLSAEDSVEELRAAVPVCGATILALKRLHLSKPAIEGLKENFGGVYTAVKAYPQYFNISASPTGKVLDALVTIVE